MSRPQHRAPSGIQSTPSPAAIDLQPDREAIYRFVRFQLEQLRAENRHHDFENIALHWGRARVARNLRPAGGPVSAGGDQGRDLETFASYYQSEGITGPIVFVCTTMRDGVGGKELEKKAKNDVKKVMAREPRPEIIYALFTADVPPATRNRIVDWARTQHDVQVEVIDGQALARDLSEPDLLWIARANLGVPDAMLRGLLPTLELCRAAALATLPVPPGITTDIRFRSNGDTVIRLGVEPGVDPLKIGPITFEQEVAERVAAAARSGEAIRLIHNEEVQEFYAEIDQRIAHLLEGARQEIVLGGRSGDPRPIRMRVNGKSEADVPYATVQVRGTHRLLIESPHLPSSLTIDFLGPQEARVSTTLNPGSAAATPLWNLLSLVHSAEQGYRVVVESLLEPGKAVEFNEILEPLAAKYRELGLFDPAVLRLCENLATIEKYAKVTLTLGLPFTEEDHALVETLREFLTEGKSLVNGSISVGGIARGEHTIDSQSSLYAGGKNLEMLIAGVPVPLGNAILLLRKGEVHVAGRRVRRLLDGQRYEIVSKSGFFLQKGWD